MDDKSTKPVPDPVSAPTTQEPVAETKPSEMAVEPKPAVVVPAEAPIAPDDRAMLQMMRQATTPEEKILALFGLIYNKLIERFSGSSTDARKSNMELEKTEMRYDLIKWVFHRIYMASFVLLLIGCVALALHAGDRPLAMDIVKFLFGAVAGFGVRAATTSATSKE